MFSSKVLLKTNQQMHLVHTTVSQSLSQFNKMAGMFLKVFWFVCEKNTILVFVLFPYGHNERIFSLSSFPLTIFKFYFYSIQH